MHTNHVHVPLRLLASMHMCTGAHAASPICILDYRRLNWAGALGSRRQVVNSRFPHVQQRGSHRSIFRCGPRPFAEELVYEPTASAHVKSIPVMCAQFEYMAALRGGGSTQNGVTTVPTRAHGACHPLLVAGSRWRYARLVTRWRCY